MLKVPCKFGKSKLSRKKYFFSLVRTISGKATENGTARYRAKFPDCAYYHHPLTGLHLSRYGFGSFRVEDEAHGDALHHALTSGINVIDTSGTYTKGRSELVVGQVVTDLIKSGEIKRDEIIVVDKAGYIQYDSLEQAKEAEKNGNPWPEVDKINEDLLWHSIHPKFLEDQITLSLNRLGLETIDIFFLLNPEHYFSRHPRTSQFDQEFYRRIREAFTHLQTEVQRGRIGWYGVSSNALGSNIDNVENISLEFLLISARLVSTNNRFAAIQFPFNPFETSTMRVKNNINSSQSALELAKRSNLLTFSNRPLNAVIGSSLQYKLVQPPNHLEKDFNRLLKDTIHYTIYLEKSYPGTDPTNKLTLSGQIPHFKELSWGHILLTHIQSLDLFRFIETRDRIIKPVVDNHMKTLTQIDGTKDWALTYKRTLWPLLEYYFYYLENARHFEIKYYLENLPNLPQLARYPSMEQKALQIPISAGVHCVLVGARNTKYVSDLLHLLRSNTTPIELLPEEWEKFFQFIDKFSMLMEQRYTPLSEQNLPPSQPTETISQEEINYGVEIAKVIPPPKSSVGYSTVNLDKDKWTILPPKQKI